jgi:hypothetical protein
MGGRKDILAFVELRAYGYLPADETIFKSKSRGEYSGRK